MIKKILLSLIAFSVLLSPVFAQDETTRTSDLVDTEIQIGTQSPWNKAVPVTIRFRSNVDAEKVEISWNTSSSIRIAEKHPQFISVSKGEVYTATANFRPTKPGSFDVTSNLTVWEVNTNYTFSESTDITFGQDLVTVPQTAGYSGAVTIYYVVLGLGGIILAVGGFYGIKYLFNRLKEWLKPPE